MFVSYVDSSQRIVSRSVDQLALALFQSFKESTNIRLTYRYLSAVSYNRLPSHTLFQTFVHENEIQEPNYASINRISDRNNYSVSDIIDIDVNVGSYVEGF